MKYNLIIAALGISLSGAGVLATVHPLVRFHTHGAESIAVPAKPAEKDTATNAFDAMSLLPGKIPAWILAQRQDYTTVADDSTHLVQFPEDARKGILRTLTTNIRSPRYAKGKLKLRSNVRAEVLADGKKITSVSKADTAFCEQSGELTLEPHKTAAIQINILSLPEDSVKPQFALSYETPGDADSLIVSGPGVTKRFSLETTVLGPRVSSASLSADGKYVALNFSNTEDGYNYDTWTEVRETGSGKAVWSSTESVEWMPYGSKLYSVRKAKEGKGYEVMLYDLKGGVPESAGTVSKPDFVFAPNGRFVIWYEEKKGKKEEGPMIRISEPDDRMPGNRDEKYLVMEDLQTGKRQPLTFGGPSTWLCDISADSRKIVYVSTRRTPSRFPFYEATMVELDLQTLRTDTLASGPGEDGFSSAVYSPDGIKLFVTAGPEAFGGKGRNAGNFEYANNFDIQGYILDIPTKEVKAVTRNFNPSISGQPVWNRKNGLIYFKAQDGFEVPVYSYDPGKEVFARLNTGIENVKNFSVGAEDAAWLVATGQGYSYAGMASQLNLKTGKCRTIADPLSPVMEAVSLGKETPWKFTAADGTEVDGMAVLPPDFDPQRKYPLIVYYYGGTSPSQKGMSNPYTPHLFASRDYVVYVLNPSGTTGYGQEYSARHVNAWGDWTADEIIEGVKKFCESHPFVDSTKIGCLGASYGGFMTQYLLTKTDMFAAAVSHAGISNVTSYWGEGYWGYSYNAIAAARSYPWSNPELFTSHGSLFNADKIHTPLLLLHGNKDTNVPVGESIQLFNALRILDRQVELIEVDGENHFIADYEKRKLWQNTIMAWFSKWLKEDSSWWNAMYGE